MDDFPEHVALMESRNGTQFKQEYNSISVEVPFTQHAAKLKVNIPKNRYKDIIPCKLNNQLFIILCYICIITSDDHSRVVLSLQNQECGSDYINASFIDVNSYL